MPATTRFSLASGRTRELTGAPRPSVCEWLDEVAATFAPTAELLEMFDEPDELLRNAMLQA